MLRTLPPVALLLFTTLAACAKPAAQTPVPVAGSSLYSDQCITEQQVVDAQKAWGDGIVNIGKVYSSGGDYEKAAADHINRFYGYDLSLVAFKPTLAGIEQFRKAFDGALSYFVAGNPSYAEDQGFALKPWTKVRWANAGIVNNSCTMAVAMGNYYFTPETGDEVKVEYTIGYVKDKQGALRMVVHHSALPYAAN
ncbi:MAG: phosphoribosyl-AMP cyclohydrolase [Myxococcota bacterium]